MYNYYNKRKFIYSLFLVVVLAIGIGYAYLTSNLSISGNTGVTTNTWNIHFENITIKDGSVTATTSPTSSKIIDYSVTYTNGNPVNIGDILNARAKKSIKVRTFYKDEIDPTDFPANDLALTLTYTLQFVQSEEDELDTNALIEQLKTENTSCFTKYTGQVTDQPNQTVTASNVYFNKCADKRNIIFNNMCWQMIRTTETGGIKMIYNGEPDNNGECGSFRSNHKGIVQSDDNTQTLNSSYLYGSSFTYDTSTSNFTLTDTETATWSDSTYEDLIGKFTCKSSSDTCTTIYQINAYKSNTQGYASPYSIGDTNYAQIGTSSYNANDRSPAMVGYMFNKVYNYKYKLPGTTEYKYGSGFTYDTSTNTYTLSGTIQNISKWRSGYNTINNTHYTCWNTSGTCSTISYIYFTDLSYAYYIDITGGKSVSDILEEMLSSNDVNRYNSSIKGIIDAWYSQNLSTKTSMLEDTVYCNGRNIVDYGPFNPNDGDVTSYNELLFKYSYIVCSLACPNETDQFAVNNPLAKLTYPIALATNEELYTLTNSDNTYYDFLTKTDEFWWNLSPHSFFYESTYVGYVDGDGYVEEGSSVYGIHGVRFVVTLSTGAVITEGDGSESSPWVILE